MKRIFFPLLILVFTLPILRADEGMWLFDAAPKQQIKEKYNFDLTDEWLDHIQKSTCRFGRGGSASFVSSNGLILTNHHVGARQLHNLSTPENNLLEKGFYAKTLADELKCSGLEILVTMLAEDVTERVNPSLVMTDAGVEGILVPPEEAQKFRNANIAALEKEYTEKTGLRCEVTTLFQGGAYYLYGYKVYTDVRLVWAPEESIGAFGGDPDNYEFPRYCVDAAFFRAYENDQPAKIEHFLKWNYDGVKDGELVFVSGFPGRTDRAFTREHLEFQRDVFFPWRLQKLFRREAVYSAWGNRSLENQRRISSDLGAAQNYRKRAMGQLAGLQTLSLWGDDIPSATKAEEGSPEWRIKEALESARKDNLYIAYDLFELGEAFNSQTFRIARNLVRLAVETEKPNAERLPEFRDDRLAATKASILSDAPIHEDVEILKLTDSLTMLFETGQFLMIGNTSPSQPSFYRILDEESPRKLATELIRGSKVRDIAERKRLIEGGIEAIEESDYDPMIVLAWDVEQDARKIREAYQEKVEAPLTAAYAELAKQRFEKMGTSVYPDATFTIRLSYGTVKGYKDDDGNDISPFTQIAGLFERAELQKFKEPFDPAPSWKDAKATLDMTVPFNLVTTNDIIGGNSGSPLINARGEVVGCVFDGNIYSLSNNFVYTDTQSRCVSVHVAVIVETLKKINKDERILAELGQ
ncbi:MAG: S46 family peptidase [Planctomycetaceae bacterium]|nr:S46 family peptidase [Planctomycetaceae bacterium]